MVALVFLFPPLRSLVRDGVGGAADIWHDATTELRSRMDTLPERQLEEQRKLAGSESLLILVLDDDDRTVALALLSRSLDDDATTALIPASLYDLLPGYGDFALADATVFEGPELTRLTVSNLLGVRIDGIVTMRPGDLASTLPPSLPVTLTDPLIVEDAQGVGTFVAEAGEAAYPPEMVELLMQTRGTSDSLTWLQRQAAVWEAIMLAARSDPAIAPRMGAFAGLDADLATGVIAGTAATGPGITVIPVERVAVSGSDAGFTLQFAEAEALVDNRMAHLDLADGERTRVEVLNGNGQVLATRKVAEALIRRGFRILITSNAQRFDYEQTLIVAQGRDNRAEAERARTALGTGELQLELRAPSGVVDVSIIVGLDIPAGEG